MISAVWIVLEFTSMLLFAGAFLEGRKPKHATIVTVITLLGLYICNNTGPLQPISPYFRYVALFCLSRHLFSGRWYIHLILETVSMLFLLIIDAAFMYGASALLHISLSEFVWRKLTYTVVGTVGKLLGLFSFWMVYRLRKSRGMKGIHGKWILLTFLFPAVSVLLLALNYYNYQGNQDISVGVFLISLILAVTNVATVYLIHSLEKSTLQEQEMALLELQIAHQKENYKALETNYSTQRKATHEFERHIQTLSDLIDRKDYETAGEYLLRLQKSPMHRVFSVHTNHPVIDVILNQKYQTAQEKDIKMYVNINDLSAVKIPTDSLVVFLANLLDNAIEACQKMTEDREIYCTILCKESLYVAIRNTSQPVEILNNEVASEKQKNLEHGYGIPAAKYILNQLSSEYTFEYRDGWFQFVADIPM